MWCPANLIHASLFRSLCEKGKRLKGGITRNQLFLLVLTCNFTYYMLPNYLFPMITSLSWICWIFPKSVPAQQMGSRLYGLGIGAIGIDWSTTSSSLGSPLAIPWFAIANVYVGFAFVIYVMTPLAYWLNVYDAKTFPIFSKDLFTSLAKSTTSPRLLIQISIWT